jgi:hypothetical protein
MARTIANRGGHAPGHLGEAMVECLERWTAGAVQDSPVALAHEEVLWFYGEQFQQHWNRLAVNERARWLMSSYGTATTFARPTPSGV